MHVAQAENEKEPTKHGEDPEDGESIMLRRVLLNTENEKSKPIQRRNLFRTRCKVNGKCCKVIVDSGSTDNIVSKEMVSKLKSKRTKHPNPYRVSWLQKEHQILVRTKFDKFPHWELQG